MVSNLGTFCVHVDAHACKAWLVDACCLSVVCQSCRFHLCMYDGFLVQWSAICVHFVGMWMHNMLAKLGWWIVVACLWLVQTGALICVSMNDLG